MQVAKNAEALQDAAVDKIPAVVDAAAGVGAAVSGAVNQSKIVLLSLKLQPCRYHNASICCTCHTCRRGSFCRRCSCQRGI